MKVIEELSRIRPEKGTVLTVGVFDGIHIGHQELIHRLTSRASGEGFLSAVVTFRQHPQTVLSPGSKMAYLISLEERTILLRNLGVELIVALSFTPELAQLTAREFAVLLRQHLKMEGLVVGSNFALGRGREGDVRTLRPLGQDLGFWIEVVPSVVIGGRVVSSTTIRDALLRGDVGVVAQLLGRHFRLKGEVVPGVERGRLLGFPTANIALAPDRALPADGVYVTRAYVEGRTYKSVTNIGANPTFGGDKRMVEVYLLDFDKNLYEHELEIELIERVRGEVRFATPEELVAQIKRDVERARAILG